MVLSRRKMLGLLALAAIVPAASAHGKQSPIRPLGLLRRREQSPAGTITPENFSPPTALAAINDIRAVRGRPALAIDATLDRLASEQARELAVLGYMTHAPHGMRLKVRAERIGYRGLVGENLADGYPTFEEAIQAWLASSSHRTTMLAERFNVFGAAVAVAPDAVPGEHGIYWVTMYGV